MPNECVLVNDLTIKEILTPELLYNYLHLYYLKDDLYEHEKELYELGVHRLDHNELIDIIKRMFTSEIRFENKKILSKWSIIKNISIKKSPRIYFIKPHQSNNFLSIGEYSFTKINRK
jgi:hypothetical protein